MILAPTRELTQQIYRECLRLCEGISVIWLSYIYLTPFFFFQGKKFRICLLSKASSAGINANSDKKIDVLISTPLRLVFAIKTQSISLDRFFSSIFLCLSFYYSHLLLLYPLVRFCY